MHFSVYTDTFISVEKFGQISQQSQLLISAKYSIRVDKSLPYKIIRILCAFISDLGMVIKVSAVHVIDNVKHHDKVRLKIFCI